jgi:1-deoxy-D-xylulose-5-phosphate reductoisomerase
MTSYISSLDKISRLPLKGRKVAVLGCTGSIGCNVLDVVNDHPEKIEIVALAAGDNVDLLVKQANYWRAPFLAIRTHDQVETLRARLTDGYQPDIFVGDIGYETLASLDDVDIVVSAQVGAAGLRPTFQAVKQGKIVALANKESMVLAGPLLRRLSQETGACILPIDSEHNALFQALDSMNQNEVVNLILTASGGPFFGQNQTFLEKVGPDEALKHPNWSMGAKISIDSATLMNKGLEVIEAHYLFGQEIDAIQVVIHPESIVHSLVEYQDGSFLAHMGVPDMRIPIAYCLGYPHRLSLKMQALDLVSLGQVTFAKPDYATFPCLGLAKEALRTGPSCPVVLNAANEISVEMFINRTISFLDIFRYNALALEKHQVRTLETLDDILDLDREVRGFIRREIVQKR